VTVAQLSHASQAHSEDVFKIDGKELHQITLVGQILRAIAQSTNMNFEVSDGTGSVDVRIWLDADEDASAQQSPAWRYVVAVVPASLPACPPRSLILI
jgi:replication factor A2